MFFILYLLIGMCGVVNGQQERYVIGCRNAGLFSNMYHTLNHLAWCSDHPLYCPLVYWDESSAYWVSEGYNGSSNVWEYYFEPVSHLHLLPTDTIHRDELSPAYFSLLDHSFTHRQMVKTIIDRYIHIKPALQKKIDSFYQEHMQNKKMIGIHLRGTDKWQEVLPVDPLTLLEYANSFQGYTYLVATDEEALLELAFKTLHGEVIAYPSQRSSTVLPLHHPYNPSHKARAGEEVLIEVLLLARCQIFIHTFSTVSSMVLFLTLPLNL